MAWSVTIKGEDTFGDGDDAAKTNLDRAVVDKARFFVIDLQRLVGLKVDSAEYVLEIDGDKETTDLNVIHVGGKVEEPAADETSDGTLNA